MISNGKRYKRRTTRPLPAVEPRDRSGSKVPTTKRKAKRRAQRKAAKR